MTSNTWWLGRIAVALGLMTISMLLAALLAGPDAPLRTAARRYLASLDRHLRFIRSPMRGTQILLSQLAVSAVAVAGTVYLELWLGLALVPAVWVIPRLWFHRAAHQRMMLVEGQVEPWINAVANALKASPSLGEAIASSIRVVPSPMSQELEVLVRELGLGTPLDDALDNFRRRIDSRVLGGTVTALKIARRSGGNLVELLESAAASLREMARLEGVVRTKTAEGKLQALVISIVPGPLLYAIHSIDPQYFRPLFHSLLGQIIVGVASALWLLAFFISQRILNVDI